MMPESCRQAERSRAEPDAAARSAPAKPASVGQNAPFFIVGSGRSGTTLLRLILAGHSRIEIPPETWFITPLVEALPLAAPLSPAQVAQAVDIMTGHYRWPDMGLPEDEFRARAFALAAPKLVDVVDLVYAAHLLRAGKPRFGDKTPPYMGIVPQLAELYPDAKFIHLVRDGRDVAMSMIDARWDFRCYKPDFVWTSRLHMREVYRSAPFADRIFDVKYEDLVADLEATVRRICAFLGEEFEPQMLGFAERIEAVPARERAIHGKLSRPVSRDAIGQWRSRLSALECFVMEACMHRELRRWGYPLRFSNAAWRPVFALARRALAVAGPPLNRAIMYLRRRDLLARTIYI
jgi:hypothetical protein